MDLINVPGFQVEQVLLSCWKIVTGKTLYLLKEPGFQSIWVKISNAMYVDVERRSCFISLFRFN